MLKEKKRYKQENVSRKTRIISRRTEYRKRSCYNFYSLVLVYEAHLHSKNVTKFDKLLIFALTSRRSCQCEYQIRDIFIRFLWLPSIPSCHLKQYIYIHICLCFSNVSSISETSSWAKRHDGYIWKNKNKIFNSLNRLLEVLLYNKGIFIFFYIEKRFY